MKSDDVIGYAHQDGFILCNECGRELDGTGEDIQVQPIFADELADFIGYGCDRCGQVLNDSGEWDGLPFYDEDREPTWDDDYDASSALASAGLGTDEDYGCYGED